MKEDFTGMPDEIMALRKRELICLGIFLSKQLPSAEPITEY